MGKDPAFLFYSSDFLTGTTFMTHEQVGKYIRLLCLQHQHGHMTEKQMLSICKTYDEDIFNRFDKDSSDCYFNKRLEVEAIKRQEYTESRRKNASKGLKNKKKQSKAYASHMENENEDINEDINIYLRTPKFNELWISFLEMRKSCRAPPTKKAIQLLMKKLHKHPIGVACEMLETSIENNWKGVFTPKGVKSEQKELTPLQQYAAKRGYVSKGNGCDGG